MSENVGIRDSFLDVLLTGNIKTGENNSNMLDNHKDEIVNIPVAEIKEYPNHMFKRIAKWDEFVESIKEHGILMPLLVVEDKDEPGKYIAIAGHNRRAAAEQIGIKDVPAVILDIDEVEASVLVGVTNCQREKVSDIEWGWAYRNTYELMKRKAGRPKENCGQADHNYDDFKNCGQADHNLKGAKTVEIIAEKYGVSAKTLQRKMRLTYLIEPLAEWTISGKLKQEPAIELSYLEEEEQESVFEVVSDSGAVINTELAEKIREKAELSSKPLSRKEIREIIFGNDKLKPFLKKKSIAVPLDYFPPTLTKPKEREAYVLKAIEYVKSNNIVLDLNNDETQEEGNE